MGALGGCDMSAGMSGGGGMPGMPGMKAKGSTQAGQEVPAAEEAEVDGEC